VTTADLRVMGLTKRVVQCLGALGSLATPSGDERAWSASDVGETTDDGTTSGDVSFAAAVAVSSDENLPVLALCTGLRTLSALRNTVISCVPHTRQITGGYFANHRLFANTYSHFTAIILCGKAID